MLKKNKSSNVKMLKHDAVFLIMVGLSQVNGSNIKMFIDFVENSRMPTLVSAIVCWDFETSRNVSLLLAHAGYPISINLISAGLRDVFPAHEALYFLDMTCPGAPEILMEAGHMLKAPYRWFLLDDYDLNGTSESENDFIISQYDYVFTNLSILPDSEVYFANRLTSDDYYIAEVYRHSLDSPVMAVLYSRWINSTLHNLYSHPVTSRRRKDLSGTTLRASLVITDKNSLEHLEDFRDQHVDTISKVNYILVRYVADLLNGSCNFSIVDSWGYRSKDGLVWNGMIGELYHNKADIGASPLFFTADRLPVIDFIAMPSATCSRFVFRSPKLSYTDNVFLLPFHRHVWYCSAALVVLICVVLLLATANEWKRANAEDMVNSSVLRPSWSDVTLVMLGAACQQGSSVLPRRFPARTVTMFLFSALFFLYISYAANIVALLQSPSTKIKTLSDLLESRLKFGVDDTVFNHYYFSTATETVRKAIYKQKIAPSGTKPRFMTLKEGVANLRKGLFAFHMEVGVGYKVVSETFFEEEKCGLQEIPFLDVIDPWMAVQKNSSYKEMVKIGMMRLHEHGLQARTNSRLYSRKPQCIGGGGHFVSVGLVDTRPAMLVLLYGVICSGIVILLEFVAKLWKTRREVSKLRFNQSIHVN